MYDTETELYYLQSRYYDPEVGRFINADGYVSTGQGINGFNMFAYCGNNPVRNVDYSGKRYCAATTIAGESGEEKDASFSFQNEVVRRSSLPRTGKPNSSDTLYNPDGTPKQKRWYGPDGNAEHDRDYNHSGNHKFPHDHEWKNGKRGKEHLDPSPEYEFTWEPVIGTGIAVASAAGMIVLAVDDATGIGVADDFLFAPLIAFFSKGFSMIF